MKKMLSSLLPSLIIFSLVCADHFMFSIDSMNFIVYIYLAFPIIFIIQGIVCSNLSSMLIGFLLSSISVLLSFSIWYNVAAMPSAVVIYLFLGVIAYFLSNHKRSVISNKKS